MSLGQAVVVVIAAISVLYYSGKAPFVIRKATEILHGKPGCVPAPALGEVTLHYFDGRGRGEAIRLMLEQASVTYNEVNFNKDTWPGHKEKGIASGLFTFGQVPAIETTNGVRMVQTNAIMHYIGRATGMECDCEDIARCEIVVLGAEDIRSKLGKVVYNPSFSLADRAEYLGTTLPVWLVHMEKVAPPLQEEPYFASSRLTWVDFTVFDLLDAHVDFASFDMGMDVKAVDPLADFPKLNTFYQKMKKLPRIASYLKSSKRRPYKIPYMPTK